VRAQHGLKMLKYLAGSVAATIVSTLTFVLTFGPALLGSRGASLAASATGAVVNYVLNRRWTWQQRGRADFRKELLPYWTTVVVTAVAAALITGLVNSIVRDHSDSRGLRTAVNALTFLGVYGLSFVVKYFIFDRLFASPKEQPAATDRTDVGPPVGSASALGATSEG
jgi:putative flippase GtrA